MLRWVFGKKAAPDPDVAPAVEAPVEDEWAFLRAQPDHDADEMAAVHGTGAAGAPKNGHFQAGEGVGSSTWDDDSESDPSWNWESPVSAAAAATYDGRLAVEGAGAAVACPPGPSGGGFRGDSDRALTIEVQVGRRKFVRRIDEDTLIGQQAGPDARPDIDLRQDPGVSRRHALISVRGGRYVLRALVDSSGTWHNGKLLQPMTASRCSPGTR